MKTQHICRFKVTGKDGRVKHDRSFSNFAFGTGIDVMSQFFQALTDVPPAYYMGLLAGHGALVKARVNDTDAVRLIAGHVVQTGGGWGEGTVNIDQFYPAGVPTPTEHVARQLWTPTISPWDGGLGDKGFQAEGSCSWTATAFYVSTTIGELFQFNLTEGMILFGTGPDIEAGLDPDIGTVFFPATRPLFMAIGETVFDTDASDEQAGTPVPPGITGVLSPGDTIDVTFKVRFSVEDLNY